MRLPMLVVLAAAPVMFAQARGGGRVVATPARRVAPVSPVRVAPAPAVRPAPVAAPVYFLGYYPNPLYYGSGNGAGYGAPGNDNGAPGPAYYGADPSGQGYPSVIVNPNYAPDTANPVMRDYSYLSPASPAPGGDDGQAVDQNNAAPAPSVIFLIAMKDHTIYPAIAYWVENDTLNYITQQGVRNQVSLGLVDRDFSTQLNKERSIDFALPAVAAN